MNRIINWNRAHSGTKWLLVKEIVEERVEWTNILLRKSIRSNARVKLYTFRENTIW